MSQNGKIILISISLYLLWTLATYLLEGRIKAFLRPEDVTARIVYIAIANLVIGIILSGMVLRHLASSQFIKLSQAGFRSIQHSLLAVAVALVLGLLVYFLQSPPSSNLVVIVNAFFQVLTVTIAEILVCWAVIGSAFESILQGKGKFLSLLIPIFVSSMLFGAYHFAHSSPFNTLRMVMFLTVIGVLTGLFFFISRNLYATIVFHNFFGIKGVMQALDKAGKLSSYEHLVFPIFINAAVVFGMLLAVHLLLLNPELNK
jgi:hypothetical protein